MKKIGKNTKLYLIGMIIGGITLGITTVLADTIINSTSVAYKTTTVKAALDELYDIADFKEEVKDMLYPVGSIYISVSSTNPSQLFGGTWVSFGMGRTLLGVGRAETNTVLDRGTVVAGVEGPSSAEQKGGEYDHTLTVNEMPAHTHQGKWNVQGNDSWTGKITDMYIMFSARGAMAPNGETSGVGNVIGYSHEYTNPSNPINHVVIMNTPYTGSTGGGSSHNNVQPYVSVYMWKRTA